MSVIFTEVFQRSSVLFPVLPIKRFYCDYDFPGKVEAVDVDTETIGI